MVTAYDATFASILDEAGVDALLVGDSSGKAKDMKTVPTGDRRVTCARARGLMLECYGPDLIVSLALRAKLARRFAIMIAEDPDPMGLAHDL